MGALASPLVIGRYAIYGKIASGGMASVHFGRLLGAAGFSRTVAIKKLHAHLAEDPDFLSTMIDEARVAARIHHPNVVPTLDVVAENGDLLVVMEYVRGEALARLLKAQRDRGRRVPLAIASAIAIDALHGLHAAHEAKSDRGEPLEIVHRDVSPQNILLGVDGLARVIDFGVAKAAGRLQTTRDGVVKGKVAYMAPEQISGSPLTRQADVYAVAVVLWEMLVGWRLFQADGDLALFGLVTAGAKEPPSQHTANLPEGLDEVVMTGLALSPANRFATAHEMAEMLKAVLPPAFPTEVGAWVEEVAGRALAHRGSLLAEIESSSGMVPVHPPESTGSFAKLGPASSRLASSQNDPLFGEVAPTSLPSSALALEAPRSAILGPTRSAGSSSKLVSVLLVVCAALAMCVVVLLLRDARAVKVAPENSFSGSAASPTLAARTGLETAAAPEAPIPSSAPEPPSEDILPPLPRALREPVLEPEPEPSTFTAEPAVDPSSIPAASSTAAARPVPTAAKPSSRPPAPARSAAPFRFALPD